MSEKQMGKKHKNKKKLIGLLVFYNLVLLGCLVTLLLLFGPDSSIHTASDSVTRSDSASLSGQTDSAGAAGMTDFAGENGQLAGDPDKPGTADSLQDPDEEAFAPYSITLMAVGDNLMHMGAVNAGKQPDGTYDYSFLYENLTESLARADISIINQETILGGNERGFSGYPYFNSPTQVGDAIATAGFNVVLQASNHTADQGLDGLKSCLDFWKNTHPEVLLCGIHEVSDTSIPVLTIGELTFAVLNFTYGPNMETLPADLDQYLNLLCDWDPTTRRLDFTTLNPKVTEDIKKASELADVVIVCPHWGTEYTFVPSSYQKTFAMQMTEAGADLIIGTHPHVVQPVEWIEASNGNRALCYYSLGNYISTQKNPESMLEAMAWVTFQVTEDAVSIDPEKTGVLPLVCQYTTGPLRVQGTYFLEDYTEELALSHGIRGYGGVTLHLEQLQEWSEEIFGDWILPKSILEQDPLTAP